MGRNRVGVCNESGCPNFTEGHAKCDDCRHATDKARGTRQARGYDASYQRELAALKATNPTHCETCGKPFGPDRVLTGGHVKRDGQRTNEPLRAECAPCNYGHRGDQ